MLEVFYETATKIVTAWRSEGRQDIRPVRDGESKVMLDILPPSGAAVRDYILDGVVVKLRPDFVSPPPPRNLFTEIDELKKRILKMEIV